jgi:hypothetical protein
LRTSVGSSRGPPLTSRCGGVRLARRGGADDHGVGDPTSAGRRWPSTWPPDAPAPSSTRSATTCGHDRCVSRRSRSVCRLGTLPPGGRSASSAPGDLGGRRLHPGADVRPTGMVDGRRRRPGFVGWHRPRLADRCPGPGHRRPRRTPTRSPGGCLDTSGGPLHPPARTCGP